MSALAFLHPALIGMGLHVASVRVRRALLGHRRYPGMAEEILRAGLEDCWSGEYLTASPGTYRQFWTRDTGFAAGSLVRLGGPWPERLLSSLGWALDVWRGRRSHVTTTINPLLRWPVDIFDYGVDSLPLLLASLRALTIGADRGVAARAEALVERHRSWISAEVEHFVELVVDPETGLVRSDRHFSAHRDTFRNGSTAYANAMVALLARTVTETGWAPDLLSHHFVERSRGRRAGGARFVCPNSGQDGSMSAAMPVAGIRTTADAADTTDTANAANAADADTADTASAAGAADDAETAETANALRMPTTGIGQTDAGVAPNSAHTNDGHGGVRSGPPDWGSLLRRHFWIGDRFRDRLDADATSGEANIWPFFAGLIDDRATLEAALETLRREGYAAPYPLKFETAHRSEHLMLAYRLWSPDYQTTTSWTSLGSIYLSLLREVDPEAASVELDRMRRLIERDGTFWEVLDDRGRPWRSQSRLSVSDVSMLWGAILLEAMLGDG